MMVQYKRIDSIDEYGCLLIVIAYFFFSENSNELFYFTDYFITFFGCNNFDIYLGFLLTFNHCPFSLQIIILFKNGTFIVPSFTRSANFDSFFSNFFTLPITREKMKIGASF